MFPLPARLRIGPPPPITVSLGRGQVAPKPPQPPFYRGRAFPFALFRLVSGALLVRWQPFGDFLISRGGRSITAHAAAGVPDSSLRDFLLTTIASFALLERGVESLHGSAVVRDRRAVAFLGQPGTGKSTLAASFAWRGWSVLTDDLLAVYPRGRKVLAYPALAEVKLTPAAARRLGLPVSCLPRVALGQPKRIWQARAAPRPTPLLVLYFPRIIAPRTRKIRVMPLSRRAAFRALLASSYNATLLTSSRLRRQFALFARLASSVPARRVLFPRGWERLEEVRERIEQDLLSLDR